MRVSVVIPALNAAPFISEAIDSCSAQAAGVSGIDLEILVVDNGSSDGTADLVRTRYGASVVLLAAAEPGAACARNSAAASTMQAVLGPRHSESTISRSVATVAAKP